MRSGLVLSFVAIAVARAGTPAPFSILFHSADTAFVGDLESLRPASPRGGKEQPAPSDAEALPRYLCEAVVRVGLLLKSGTAEVRAGHSFSIIAESSAAECHFGPDAGQVSRDQPALWLIRTENGTLHTSADDFSTVFPLQRRLLPFEVREIEEWNEADEGVMYLFLKPGLIIPESQYANSSRIGQMVDLKGWTSFLKVYRTAYSESSAYDQGQISLVAASYDHCLGTARKALAAKGDLHESKPGWPESDDMVRSKENTLLEWMSWTSKDSVLKAFYPPEEPTNELTRWACSSLPRVKAKARSFLSRYFGIESATLPCLPCE